MEIDNPLIKANGRKRLNSAYRYVPGLVYEIEQMSAEDRHAVFTWFRQMMDYYGYDSIEAAERGIDDE